MPAKEPPFKRLLSGYEKDADTMCWIWKGHKNKNGYGSIKAFGKMVSVHRLSYELHKGPIKDGMEILHSCDVALCINPDHLRQGTHAENMTEAAKRNRMPSGEDHWMRVSGNPTKGVKSKQSIQVMVLGQPYGSLKEAERKLGLGGGTVAYWMKNAPDKAYRITLKEYNNAE